MAGATTCGVVLLLLTAVLTISSATKIQFTLQEKSEIGSKKVLVLLPLAAPSHHSIFSSLITELLARGHYVTIVSARAQKAKQPRLREILIKDPMEDFLRDMTTQAFDKPKGPIENTLMMAVIGSLLYDGIFTSPAAMALKDEKFDLLITEAYFFQEPLLGFAHHFGCPSMVLNPVGYMLSMNHFTGGAVNPAYVPNVFITGMDPTSFLDRVKNTFLSAFWMGMYSFVYLPHANTRLHEVFPDAPPIQDLVQNISLVLLNNNNALMEPVPLAPSVIEVPGIHIKPGKPLPADLKKWMEDSKDGVVYFSFGSNIQPGLLPADKRDAIFESFRKLKQRVLVKWNAELPPNPPKNCRFEDWVPQQEVLVHPNLKVFVSHGGLLSTQESVYYGAAVIAIPVFGDQHMNAATATAKGFAITVSLYELTTELLDAALHEVISNPKYRERSKELSLRFRMDPTPSLEKAVYYTEQLMKLGNFKHLRPSSVYLHWYQYLLLDVLAVIAIALYLSYKIIRFICSTILGCCRNPSKPKKD